MTISEQTEGRLFRIAEAGNMGGGVQTLSDVLRKAAESAQLEFNHDGGVTGVTTGLRNLDRRLGGLQLSDFMILAGWPSMGKTALAASVYPCRFAHQYWRQCRAVPCADARKGSVSCMNSAIHTLRYPCIHASPRILQQP